MSSIRKRKRRVYAAIGSTEVLTVRYDFSNMTPEHARWYIRILRRPSFAVRALRLALRKQAGPKPRRRTHWPLPPM